MNQRLWITFIGIVLVLCFVGIYEAGLAVWGWMQ
jgi:hypothetical protein